MTDFITLIAVLVILVLQVATIFAVHIDRKVRDELRDAARKLTGKD